jgi:hypothetical protein
MPAPATPPDDTTMLDATPQTGQRVWVWANGQWHPGVVLDAVAAAALVAYRTRGMHRLTDTVSVDYLAARVEPDAVDENR